MAEQTMKQVQERMINAGIWQSCINCDSWSPEGERCLLYKARPPADVIVTSCEKWEQDIPF